MLTVPLVSNPINTISELADYALPVSSFGDTFYKLANQSLDANLKKIAEDYIVHYDFDQAIANASSSVVVMAESKQFLDYIVRWDSRDQHKLQIEILGKISPTNMENQRCTL